MALKLQRFTATLCAHRFCSVNLVNLFFKRSLLQNSLGSGIYCREELLSLGARASRPHKTWQGRGDWLHRVGRFTRRLTLEQRLDKYAGGTPALPGGNPWLARCRSLSRALFCRAFCPHLMPDSEFCKRLRVEPFAKFAAGKGCPGSAGAPADLAGSWRFFTGLVGSPADWRRGSAFTAGGTPALPGGNPWLAKCRSEFCKRLSMLKDSENRCVLLLVRNAG